MAATAESLRLALIGCGRIASFHIDGIEQRAERTRIVAAIDPNPAAAAAVAERCGARAYASLDDALNDDGFDAVDIMVPHDLHEEIAVAAFAAGKHVLLEKPMADTLEACARIQAAAAVAGTTFMVAENSQYWPDVVAAGALVASGEVGEIVTARAAFQASLDPFWYPADSWRFQLARAGGGVVIDGGAHWIRPLRMWLGEVEETVAATERVVPAMQGESLAYAILRFRTGLLASFEALTLEAPLWAGPWWRLTGSAGEVVIKGGFEGGLTLVNRQHPDGVDVDGEHGYAASFGPQLADFEAAVLDGKQPEAAAAASLGELRTALAMYRSAQSGKWEKVW
jgi:UDP-N-acetyl-2-amino-2-deoxyglucuronate dehydrogenase